MAEYCHLDHLGEGKYRVRVTEVTEETDKHGKPIVTNGAEIDAFDWTFARGDHQTIRSMRLSVEREARDRKALREEQARLAEQTVAEEVQP